MSLAYIRKSYGVPAEHGGRVRYTGGAQPELGTITGAQGVRVLVRLDGEDISAPFHPTWKLEYLPRGEGSQ